MRNIASISVITVLIFNLAVSTAVFSQTAHNKIEAKHKIVMQLTSSDTLVHAGLFKQLKNLKEGWGENVAIEVVCHGPGINLLHTEKNKYAEAIENFTKQGVVFVACENTLKEKNIAKEKISHSAVFVLMGIGEIVEKQEQGWSYIKAGF